MGVFVPNVEGGIAYPLCSKFTRVFTGNIAGDQSGILISGSALSILAFRKIAFVCCSSRHVVILVENFPLPLDIRSADIFPPIVLEMLPCCAIEQKRPGSRNFVEIALINMRATFGRSETWRKGLLSRRGMTFCVPVSIDRR